MPIANLKQTPIENIAFEFLQANIIYPANDPIWKKSNRFFLTQQKKKSKNQKNV